MHRVITWLHLQNTKATTPSLAQPKAYLARGLIIRWNHSLDQYSLALG
jgi:hypothetical protein